MIDIPDPQYTICIHRSPLLSITNCHPKTDDHDLNFKVRHIRRFLEAGHRVRLVIAFRGRELAHAHTGKLIVDRVVERSADLAHIEADGRLEGRRMIALIAPRPRRGRPSYSCMPSGVTSTPPCESVDNRTVRQHADPWNSIEPSSQAACDAHCM
jgi:hypothetical protein